MGTKFTQHALAVTMHRTGNIHGQYRSSEVKCPRTIQKVTWLFRLSDEYVQVKLDRNFACFTVGHMMLAAAAECLLAISYVASVASDVMDSSPLPRRKR